MTEPVDLSLGIVDPDLDLFELRGHGPDWSKYSNLDARYAPRGGLPALRHSIAAVEGVDPMEVTVTTGASMALTAIFADLPVDANVLLPRPYFPAYPNMLRALGRRATFYSVKPGICAFEAICKGLDGAPHAVVVNSPGNPLGNVLDRETIAAIRAATRQASALLVIDETYAGMVFNDPIGNAYEGTGVSPGTLRVGSLSKRCQLAGARVGYVVGEAETISRIEAVHWTLAMSVPAVSQLRAAAALLTLARRGYDPRPRQRLGQLCARALDWLDRPELAPVAPAGGPLIWVAIPGAQASGLVLAQRCAEKAGVLVSPGELFGVKEPAIRCCFALPEARLDAAFDRLARALVEEARASDSAIESAWRTA